MSAICAAGPTKQKFNFHWGEMGTRWGVNRSVAQIHALLFHANRPLTAEDIAEALAVARSNVSNGLFLGSDAKDPAP